MKANHILTSLAIVIGVGLIGAAIVWVRTPSSSPIAGVRPVSEPRAPDVPTMTLDAPELSPPPAPVARDVTEPAIIPPPEAPAPAVSEAETWAKKYAGKSSKEIHSLRMELNEKIGTLATPDLNRMYDTGRFETLHRADEPSTEKDWNPDVVMSLRTPAWSPGGPAPDVQRAILPERDYPELYAMRREERWLEKQYYEVQRQEMTAKNPK